MSILSSAINSVVRTSSSTINPKDIKYSDANEAENKHLITIETPQKMAEVVEQVRTLFDTYMQTTRGYLLAHLNRDPSAIVIAYATPTITHKRICKHLAPNCRASLTQEFFIPHSIDGGFQLSIPDQYRAAGQKIQDALVPKFGILVITQSPAYPTYELPTYPTSDKIEYETHVLYPRPNFPRITKRTS